MAATPSSSMSWGEWSAVDTIPAVPDWEDLGLGPKVYVAGPMSSIGPPTWNFPAFREAADRIRQVGWKPVVPIDDDDLTDEGQPTREWHEYLRRDLKMLVECDAIALLPDWWDSRGASLEAHVAVELGMPAYDAQTLLPIPSEAVRHALKHGVSHDETVLEEAQRLIYGDRQEDYGHPLDDFTRTGRIWGAILGTGDIPAEQVALCMVGVKISREVNHPKRDNRVDGPGYWGCLDMVHEERSRRMAQATE